MPNIVPITTTDFADKRWKPVTNYLFAAKDTVCPLTRQELIRAVLSIPIGFFIQDEKTFPVALQGFKPQQNLLITADGRWIGRYIPAAYRAYPFRLGKTEEGQQLLCIDTDSGCVSDTEGHSFFTDGKASEETSKVFNLLNQLQQDRLLTEKVCAVLSQHELIQPWPISLKSGEKEVAVEGINRIDETALNALDKDSFEEIRSAGALPLVYCQLLSMQHLASLGSLVDKKSEQEAEKLDIEKLFGERGDQLFKFS